MGILSWNISDVVIQIMILPMPQLPYIFAPSSKPSNCGLPMFPQQLDSVDIVINEQGGSKEKDDATSYKTIQERQEWTLKSFLFGRK